VRDFVANSDVVVQNFATGVLDRLGLGYDELRRINPRIVLASISGYGQTGPWRSYMGYGPSAAALTGLCSVTGYVGGGPEELGLSMPDPTAGITAALGVLAALLRRDQTGVGDHVDVSLWEASAVLGVEAWMQHVLAGVQPHRQGNRDAAMAPHGCFRCLGDEAWVTIACRSDAEWQRLATLVDPLLAQDPRFATLAARKANEDALDALLTAWTSTQDRWAITGLLQGLGIPAFPSQSARDVVDDPHLNARGAIERLAHPAVGARPHVGIPWRLHVRPNGVRRPAPCIGADTDAALREVAGYDDARIAALRAAGALT
jgi:crotonobetainyl-CoA:carnitine CoA-transferase CaiB-like acyl-CoA transferase